MKKLIQIFSFDNLNLYFDILISCKFGMCGAYMCVHCTFFHIVPFQYYRGPKLLVLLLCHLLRTRPVGLPYFFVLFCDTYSILEKERYNFKRMAILC